MIRYAKKNDLLYLKKDDHINRNSLEKKIVNNEVLVCEKSSKLIGWLRFNYFWDIIPFMNMLYVEENYRHNGYGTELVSFWEIEMYKNGHIKTMTSTVSNEKAQHFYRKLGYRDMGSLLLPDEPLEIFFMKKIEA